MTGDDLLTDSARVMLLCQKTPAIFTCGDPRCVYSVITWEAVLPAFTSDTPRAGPKCPQRHRAQFVAPLEPLEA